MIGEKETERWKGTEAWGEEGGERERQRESLCVKEREGVCVCERESVCVSERERERFSV